jgi:hypothetical protein
MFHLWLSRVVVFVAPILFLDVGVARAAEFQKGTYSGTLHGDKMVTLEFKDEKGSIASKDAKPGKYKWKLDDKKLTFTKVEDESEGRSKGITGTTWTLQK